MEDDNARQSVSSCVREEMNLPGKKDGAPFCLAGVEVRAGQPRMVGSLVPAMRLTHNAKRTFVAPLAR